MRPDEKRSDLGSVAVYVISPTRTVLVIDESFQDAHWKLMCGGIEEGDGGAKVAHIADATERTNARVIAAAIREVREESGGIELVPDEVTLIEEQTRVNGKYFPYFCVACISERKLDMHGETGDEDGKKLTVADFYRSDVPEVLERHRPFVQKIENAMK